MCQTFGEWPFPNPPGAMTFAQTIFLGEALYRLSRPNTTEINPSGRPKKLSAEEKAAIQAHIDGNKRPDKLNYS